MTRFLSPEGRCVAYPVGVQLRLFPFIEFLVRKLDFKTNRGYRVFFARKCFILRREMRSISIRGPIETPFIEFWFRKGILDFRNLYGLSCFFCEKMFYLMGWDGWL